MLSLSASKSEKRNVFRKAAGEKPAKPWKGAEHKCRRKVAHLLAALPMGDPVPFCSFMVILSQYVTIIHYGIQSKEWKECFRYIINKYNLY